MSGRCRVIAIVAGAVALLAIGSTAAQGADYQVWNCYQSTGYSSSTAFAGHMLASHWQAGRWYDPSPEHPHVYGGPSAVDECPQAFEFAHPQGAEQTALSVVWYDPLTAGTTSTIKRLKFTTWGGAIGDGFKYTVNQCAGECDEVAEIEPGASADNPQTFSVDLSALDLHTVAIQAECVAAACPAGPSFNVHDIEMAFNDPEPPVLTALTSDPAGAFDPSSGVWVHGKTVKFHLEAGDSGSGVLDGALGTGVPATAQQLKTSCVPSDEEVEPVPCNRAETFDGFVDLSGLNDGDQQLAVTLGDGAGNHGTTSLPFKLDNTPPAEPQGLRLTPANATGWTADPHVEVAVDDPANNAVNTGGSGFAGADFDLRSSAGEASPPVVSATDLTGPVEITIPNEGAWELGARYRDGAGNTGDRAHIAIGYDTDTPQPPEPAVNDWLNLDQLIDGYDQSWTAPAPDPDLESGICGYSFAIDDDRLTIPPATANLAATATSAPVPAKLRSGRFFAHVRTVACNGKASTTATTPVNVDAAPPVATLYGVTAGDWMRIKPSASIVGSDALSGVTTLHYGFDGGLQTDVAAATAPIDLPEGQHLITWSATDAAGNRSAPASMVVRGDWSAPEVTFKPRDLRAPNQFVADVTDPYSGVASALMQYRATAGADTTWHSFGQAQQGGGDHALELSADLPDGQLAAGHYELRVVAVDTAGNSTADGGSTALGLDLPLRGAASLSAGVSDVKRECRTAAGRRCSSAARCPDGQKCTLTPVVAPDASSDRVARYGADLALTGTLTDAAGRPVSGTQLSIWQLPEFGTLRQVASVVTGPGGEYSFLLPKGQSSTYTVEFAGDGALQPAAGSAELGVRASLSFHVRPERVAQGRPFRLNGRLLSGSLGTPEGGKVVAIEYLRGRNWVTMANVRIDSRGRFSLTWPGVTSATATTLYLHAGAIRDGAWPFLTGYSKTAALRISR